jgi:hypothetical protein
MNISKWEYRVIYISDESDIEKFGQKAEKRLNGYGECGWELVSMTPIYIDSERNAILGHYFYFKRVVVEDMRDEYAQ